MAVVRFGAYLVGMFAEHRRVTEERGRGRREPERIGEVTVRADHRVHDNGEFVDQLVERSNRSGRNPEFVENRQSPRVATCATRWARS